MAHINSSYEPFGKYHKPVLDPSQGSDMRSLHGKMGAHEAALPLSSGLLMRSRWWVSSCVRF